MPSTPLSYVLLFTFASLLVSSLILLGARLKKLFFTTIALSAVALCGHRWEESRAADTPLPNTYLTTVIQSTTGTPEWDELAIILADRHPTFRDLKRLGELREAGEKRRRAEREAAREEDAKGFVDMAREQAQKGLTPRLPADDLADSETH
ncbi:hypothetical protein [Achromobacter sp. 2789STDY5608633]|uniref:hypothetical protein n=1 Tax=Achromobacter sp. 2789STDY5608633 TaxID=1806501 RepID=UPI0012E1AE90|nr:hypothetical protein [Achromobacter sp. 2789STDY5608633]